MLPPFSRLPVAAMMSVTMGIGMEMEGSEAFKDVAKAVVFEPGPSRFSFSAGASVRAIGADFRQDGHSSAIDWLHDSGLRQGRGDVGIFRGGRRGEVIYDDGSVGPGYEAVPGLSPDGTAYGSIDRRSQIIHTGRADVFGDPIYAAAFHTYELDHDRTTQNASDDAVAAGPYLQMSYRLFDDGDSVVNAIIGWSRVETDHQTGAQQILSVERTDYTYIYDTVLVAPLPGFPYVDPATPAGLGTFIIDAGNPAIAGLGRNPFKKTSEPRIVAIAMARSDLDVTLNEIPIGFEVGKRFGKIEVLLTGGASLNVIGYDLDSSIVWHRSGMSSVTQRWSNSGTALKVGLFGGLVTRVPLCESGRIYFEAHGTYRWVDPIDVTAGFASVEIDPSSWEGGLGIGILW